MRYISVLGCLLVWAMVPSVGLADNAKPAMGQDNPYQAEVLADGAESVQWFQVILSMIQAPMAMMSGNAGGTTQAIAQAQNQINAMAAKNPSSLFAYHAQCLLYKLTKQDFRPYCQYVLSLADDKLNRHPDESMYYLVKSQTQEILGEVAAAKQTLLTAKKNIPSSNKKELEQIDDALVKLERKNAD